MSADLPPEPGLTDSQDRPISRREFFQNGLVGTGAVAVGLGLLPRIALAGKSVTPTAGEFDSEVPTAWFDLSLILVQRTAGYTPPVASRAFAYAGIALYESVVSGMPGFRSLSGQLNGLSELPEARENRRYHWPTVANSSLGSILRNLFPTATAENLATIDSTEAQFAARFRPTLPPGVYRRSVEHGQRVAAAVFEWSKSDGGHEGYLRNFPMDYIPPAGPGLWVPTPPGFLRALQPFWGANRTFAIPSADACPPGDHTPYSERPTSRPMFYAEAIDVYHAVNNLTTEQRDIALFWSDDPGSTPTPPGHSVSILTQVLRQKGSSLAVAAEAYAKLGIAVSDAFICCWDVKYRYNLLRPVTYIQALIDPSWMPLLTTPPFPEYTSGHSVQSGAAAEVVTDMFGRVSFTDHTHDARGLAPRSFDSFRNAAEEAAISRFYGGIHFRPAIELGLAQGRCIGKHVTSLRFRH
jgi:hypothetical protein